MFGFEIWLDGCMLHEEDGFDSKEEAYGEAVDWVADDVAGCEGSYMFGDYDIKVVEK